MNRERFVNGLKDAPHYSKKQRKNIIGRSLKSCNWKTKCTVANGRICRTAAGSKQTYSWL